MLVKTDKKERISCLARLFSPTVLQELSRFGKSPLFARLGHKCDLQAVSVGTFFNSAFEILKERPNRHEYVYKNAIARKVLLGKHSPKTATMLTEFRVDRCKADVVILNGTSSIYEIKSERDSLDRLPSQIDAYRKVSARVYAIAGEKHIDKISNIVPEDVGILLLSRRHTISTIREALNDPSRIDPETLFRSLRVSEAKKILTKMGQEVPELPNTLLYDALRNVFKNCDAKQLHAASVQTLRQSRSPKPLVGLIDLLPSSLTAATISTTLQIRNHDRLVQSMDTPIREALSWS